MTIVVVQCGSAKLDHPAAAQDLYVGSLFRKLKSRAQRIATRWYIASAKHGLLDPHRIVVPYNETLPPAGDVAWGRRVGTSLKELYPEGWDRLIAFCSRRYLVGWANELGAEQPLAGLTIGRMMQRTSFIS